MTSETVEHLVSIFETLQKILLSRLPSLLLHFQHEVPSASDSNKAFVTPNWRSQAPQGPPEGCDHRRIAGKTRGGARAA